LLDRTQLDFNFLRKPLENNILIFSLWLNEGFAHYMQYLGISHVLENKQNALDAIVLRGLHTGLAKGNYSFLWC